MNSKSYIQANPEQELLFCLSRLEIKDVLPEQSQFKALAPNNCRDFWQLWESSQDDFYKCCLKWMGGNSHNAEDALNQAMLKACNEWTKSATKITYPKAWLARLIYNFCMDVHRKHKREAPGIENIDDIKFADHPAFACRVEFPESNILNLEMQAYLHHRIESLPDRLRHPFILHCCQDKSYQDVAKQLTLSEENVRKRIQEARRILQKQLKKYLAGEDNTSLYSPSPPLKKVIPMVEEFHQVETVICNWESPATTKSKNEEINYKVTVICLETLPPSCCSLPNSPVWR
ncbi:sigma-70 family RNA polymerase sigma factor [Plectonema radiosum NIES-515]|uniref:Sigma-70 family RNA polymerase sigma factor n=1 Tax=Plectonema radiosum NIES-515 TaxID=2986073 RepID=A0ABT3B595_9CYAN|nr:sigma-70 family RNA polymerase sigma factor [Plectonema radiosum]MCV3216120.1 sigma-70 family RNA polymerase sigma factor [Plectonema radiosum NIES-515]